MVPMGQFQSLDVLGVGVGDSDVLKAFFEKSFQQLHIMRLHEKAPISVFF